MLGFALNGSRGMSDYWDHRPADPRGQRWHAPASSGRGASALGPTRLKTRRGPVPGVVDYWQRAQPVRTTAGVAVRPRPAVPPVLVASVVSVLLAGIASAAVRAIG